MRVINLTLIILIDLIIWFLIGAPIVVEGIIFNLKPNSNFGLHVHEQGDITNACQSTGAHFNPLGKQVDLLKLRL